MRYVRYDKKYNTRIIRATLLMLNAMIDSNEIGFDYFNDYTGLSSSSYIRVFRIIQQMIIDLQLNYKLEKVKIIHISKYTKYYSYKYKLKTLDEYNYSYSINSNLDYTKRIDYSMTIVYLMLKSKENVTYNKLASIFPLFTRNRFETLLYYLRMLIDEEVYIENKIYKLREYNAE